MNTTDTISNVTPSYAKDTTPSECILEGWMISLKRGCGFFLYSKWGCATPKVGDTLTMYTVNYSTVRGVDINGNMVFYKSDETLEKEHQDYKKDYEAKKLADFEKGKDQLDKNFDALPDFFQKRILGFREKNPKFRVDYESYEMFCCKEAMKIVTAIPDLTASLMTKFKDLSFEAQLAAIPTLSDGHSGNTFNCACALALAYVLDPSKVLKVHGALTPLVGSVEYGE